MPKRIQRKRTPGSRMPAGAAYCGRPGPYGNNFEVVNAHKQGFVIYDKHRPGGFLKSLPTRAEAHAESVRMFAEETLHTLDLRPLRGLDLACWCGLDEPCHVDVILKAANARTVPLMCGLCHVEVAAVMVRVQINFDSEVNAYATVGLCEPHSSIELGGFADEVGQPRSIG